MTYGGGSIKANGVYEQVKAALGSRTVVELDGIEPNPRYETLMKGVGLVKEHKLDFLLAVGGAPWPMARNSSPPACRSPVATRWRILSEEAEVKIRRAARVRAHAARPRVPNEHRGGHLAR